MGLHKILRDGGGVMIPMHGFQRSFLAERWESVFKIACGRIQKIFQYYLNHSPILYSPIHIFLFLSLSLSLSLSCMAAPYNLQGNGSQSFVIHRPAKQHGSLSPLHCVFKSIKKYISMAFKFLIKEPTLFGMVSVEFVTIAGNTTRSFMCHKSHHKCL